MDLRRQLNVLRRFAPLIVASVALAAIAAYAVSNALPPTYEASTRLIVGSLGQGSGSRFDQSQLQRNRAEAYASRAVEAVTLEPVIDTLGLEVTVDELQDDVSADVDRDTTIITITAAASDPERAARIANAIAAEIVAFAQATSQLGELDQFVAEQLGVLRTEINALQGRESALAELERPSQAQAAELVQVRSQLATVRASFAGLLSLAAGNAAAGVTVLFPAEVPAEPASPQVLLNVALALLLALVISIAVAFALDHLDDTLKVPDDVEVLTGVPALGAVVSMPGSKRQSPVYRLQALLYPRSVGAERFRTMRTNIEFASLDKPLRSILVTSSIAGEGKTTVATNLAIVFAQAGHSVLLVDADLRRPGVNEFFNMPNERGLGTLLLSDASFPIDRVAQRTETEGLRVITTGPIPPNPAELLASERMVRLMERFAGEADVVIVDSPPLQAVTDAAIVATLVDATLLVVQAGRTRRAVVGRSLDALGKVGAQVKGIVLNRMPNRRSDPYYGYVSDQTGGGKPPTPSRSSTAGAASTSASAPQGAESP
jgi:capsular exopolysaccharide synthesis family protein